MKTFFGFKVHKTSRGWVWGAELGVLEHHKTLASLKDSIRDYVYDCAA